MERASARSTWLFLPMRAAQLKQKKRACRQRRGLRGAVGRRTPMQGWNAWLAGSAGAKLVAKTKRLHKQETDGVQKGGSLTGKPAKGSHRNLLGAKEQKRAGRP
eukprot:1161592-Pelagomonas_calceolata.AAC.5